MPPRRTHKKSRNGCRRCKVRKIKCDEVHPRCGPCIKHGVPCDFESSDLVLKDLQQPAVPVASRTTSICRLPSTPLLSATTPSRHRLLELKLMHHYTAATFSTVSLVSATHDVWKADVPRIALSGPKHLIDAILSVAALHLRSLVPHDEEMYRAFHAYMASSLADYNATLTQGIDDRNAEALFLTSALITFQAIALRSLMKDELTASATTGYSVPLAWFHAAQGCKVVTAASWRFLRNSPTAMRIIGLHDGINLDRSGARGFFSDLLDDLEDELAAIDKQISNPSSSSTDPGVEYHVQKVGLPQSLSSSAYTNIGVLPSDHLPQPGESVQVTSTRNAYRLAVTLLNWAHKIPHKSAATSLPGAMPRRFVELLEERRPRALAILTCFFALLKIVDGGHWWLRGMVQREVLGLVGLFTGGAFGPEIYRRWRPHLEWAARIASWDDGTPIPPEVWGLDWAVEEQKLAKDSLGKDFISRFDALKMKESPHDEDADAPSPPP